MRFLICILVLLTMILSSCTTNNPVACTQEAKLCPDGTAVGRVPPNCEFEECPAVAVDEGQKTAGCNYEVPDKNYIGKSKSACEVIKFMCEQSQKPFFDECGCGCGKSGEQPSNGESNEERSNESNLEEHYCSAESRNAEMCIELYNPVCGWFNPEKIQCIKYPCGQTFSNSCFSCSDEKVLYWTQGECPE